MTWPVLTSKHFVQLLDTLLHDTELFSVSNSRSKFTFQFYLDYSIDYLESRLDCRDEDIG